MNTKNFGKIKALSAVILILIVAAGCSTTRQDRGNFTQRSTTADFGEEKIKFWYLNHKPDEGVVITDGGTNNAKLLMWCNPEDGYVYLEDQGTAAYARGGGLIGVVMMFASREDSVPCPIHKHEKK